MIIDQLPNIQLPVLGTDEMPVERGQYTYKAAFEDISATIKNGLDVIRPNLLDNWYFLSGEYQGLPINSRNKSTYNIPPAARTYTIDRWFVFDRGGDGTFKIYSNGIKLNRSGSTVEFGQVLEPVLLGETVTISVLAENNSRLSYGTGVVANNAVLIDDTYLTASFTRENAMTILHLIFKSSSPLVSAAKLEIGDSQTLAHEVNGTWVLNELPNYEEQLTRCMVSRADPSDIYANNVISYNAPNPNLLDNWYFVGGGSQQGGGQFPINQRGQTSYSGKVRGIDRFVGETGSSVTVNSSYTSFTGIVKQMISLAQLKDLTGKTITISALQYYNGQTYLKSASGIVNAYTTDTDIYVDFEGSGSIGFRMFSSAASWQGCRISGPVNLIAVKLEIGSTQTLAHQENGTWVLNEIPDYSEQLYRCCASSADPDDTYANNPYFAPSVEVLPLDSSIVSASTCSLARYGKLRILNLAAEMINSGTWQTVYTLSSSDKPKEQVTSIAGGYGKQMSEVYVQHTDGSIQINAIESGWLKCTAIWLVK